MNVNKILVGIDIDKSSKQVINFCFQLASKSGASLDFLYIQKEFVDINIDNQQIQEENLFKLIALVEEAGINYESTDFKCDVDANIFVKNGLLANVTEYDYDILVLGIHNKKGLFDREGKSLSIVNEAKIPVILIPESFRSITLDHLVFSIEFEFNEIDYLFDMVALCKALDGHLTCVHVNTADNLQTAHNKLKTYTKLFESYIDEGFMDLEIINGTVEQSLNIFASENDVDLIVMLKERKNWKNQYLKTSKERKLVKEINIPIMLLNQ